MPPFSSANWYARVAARGKLVAADKRRKRGGGGAADQLASAGAGQTRRLAQYDSSLETVGAVANLDDADQATAAVRLRLLEDAGEAITAQGNLSEAAAWTLLEFNLPPASGLTDAVVNGEAGLNDPAKNSGSGSSQPINLSLYLDQKATNPTQVRPPSERFA